MCLEARYYKAGADEGDHKLGRQKTIGEEGRGRVRKVIQ